MITYDANARDIIQESFNLLRQDFAAPAVASPAVSIDEVADDSLEWQKARLAVKTAANEVYDAHGWSGGVSADNIGAWPYRIRNALVYCIARELSIPIAGRIEDMKTFDALYRDKIMQAKIADLEAEKAAVEDPDMKRLIATITMDFTAMQSLPRSFAAMMDRIEAVKESARREVLLAHPWRFATRTEPAASEPYTGDIAYRYACVYPKCLRLIAAIGPDGYIADWKIWDGFVLSTDRVVALRYIADVADTGKWPAVVHNVYIHRLAADVARTVMGNGQDAQMQEAIYQQALGDAKLRDTSESQAKRDAWGKNPYVEAIRNGVCVPRRPDCTDRVLNTTPFQLYRG